MLCPMRFSTPRDLHFSYTFFGLKITRFQHFTKCELSMSFRFCACVFIALHGLVTLAFDLFFSFFFLFWGVHAPFACQC